MIDEDFISFWGINSLTRWPPEVVATTTLPEVAKQFLVKVGMPMGIDWSIRFNTERGRLPELERYPGRYVIGRATGRICLDASEGGTVVGIDVHAERPRPVEFINSDVRLFAEFLVLYQQFRLRVDDLGELDQKALVTATKQKMSACDSPALTVPGAFWAATIEEMYVGWM